ncbi:hypothetical protein COV13_01300 [Candidatus Woesearchaeota archaeon CG10_big_fil_rev_8_21_14_0_10_32_9]|nr:MAG: hypothetical protein COV13_01300 [Candidatus Woesearchaeota archaeon CG10_big_fil_rev_8_21_14_0_10_32_9]
MYKTSKKAQQNFALIGFFLFISVLFVVAINSNSFDENRFSAITAYVIAQDTDVLAIDEEYVKVPIVKDAEVASVEQNDSNTTNYAAVQEEMSSPEVIEIPDYATCSSEGVYEYRNFSINYYGPSYPVYYFWEINSENGASLFSNKTYEGVLTYTFPDLGDYYVSGSMKLRDGHAISFACDVVSVTSLLSNTSINDSNSFFLSEGQSYNLDGNVVLLERVGETSVVVSVNGQDRGVISVGEYKIFDDLDGQLALDSVYYVEGASDNGALFTFVSDPVVVNGVEDSIKPKKDEPLISTITSFFTNLFRS